MHDSYFRDENCVPNYEFYQQYVPFILLFAVLFTINDFIYICNKYTKRFTAVYEY